MASSDSYVVSLGGSVMMPGGPDIKFIKKFCEIILSHGGKFVIFTGGGSLTRELQELATKSGNASQDDMDLIGIQPTRINALLLRSFIGKDAHEEIIDNPTRKFRTEKKVALGCGWKPGASTDSCAVNFAVANGIKNVVNISNTHYVYDKDPKAFKDARPIEKMGWDQMQVLVGDEWKPGLHKPFDPIATRLASKKKLKVMFLGPDLRNFRNYLEGKPYKGTTVT